MGSVDPLLNDFVHYSPYNYALNNPIETTLMALNSTSSVMSLIPSDPVTDLFPLGLATKVPQLLKFAKGITKEQKAMQLAKAIGKNSIELGDVRLYLDRSRYKDGVQ